MRVTNRIIDVTFCYLNSLVQWDRIASKGHFGNSLEHPKSLLGNWIARVGTWVSQSWVWKLQPRANALPAMVCSRPMEIPVRHSER